MTIRTIQRMLMRDFLSLDSCRRENDAGACRDTGAASLETLRKEA
jgi:hypothetical protein